MIETWIITIATFLLGYFLGRQMLNKQNVDNLWKRARDIGRDKYVGTVKRPSADKLYRRDNPKLAEEANEMKKALDGLNAQERYDYE